LARPLGFITKRFVYLFVVQNITSVLQRTTLTAWKITSK